MRRFISNLDSDFGTSRQQDAEELLSKLLDAIHMELSTSGSTSFTTMTQEIQNLLIERDKAIKGIITKEDYRKFRLEHSIQDLMLKAFSFWKRQIKHSVSPITCTFTGLFMSVLECMECHYLSGSFEPFNVLSVPIADDHHITNLTDSLKEFSKIEIMTGKNQWFCPKCDKKVDAKKVINIFQLPEVLIIQLKRFKSNNSGYQQKITSYVEFPLTDLCLAENTPQMNIDESLYDLRAVTNHHGSLIGGHYTAFCKNDMNNQWYKFDDSSAYHIPENKLKFTIVKSEAYILYYERRRKEEEYIGIEV
jgi:ubiquitin C-terminal hydrolase